MLHIFAKVFSIDLKSKVMDGQLYSRSCQTQPMSGRWIGHQWSVICCQILCKCPQAMIQSLSYNYGIIFKSNRLEGTLISNFLIPMSAIVLKRTSVSIYY